MPDHYFFPEVVIPVFQKNPMWEPWMCYPGFIECFRTTFLHAHPWLNWVDEDDVGLKENPENPRYIKIRPEAPGVRAKDLIPNFPIIGDSGGGGGGCRQVHHAWKHLTEMKSQQGGAYNRVFNFCPPPPPQDQRKRCSKILNLNGWTAFCCHARIFYSWYPGHGNREPTVLKLCPDVLSPCDIYIYNYI